jgi:predicted dehydrogenase
LTNLITHTVHAGEAPAVFEMLDTSRSLVTDGRGEVRSVHADHTQRLPSDEKHRINNPYLAGDALLDLGIYPISFAFDMLGGPAQRDAVPGS